MPDIFFPFTLCGCVHEFVLLNPFNDSLSLHTLNYTLRYGISNLI